MSTFARTAALALVPVALLAGCTAAPEPTDEETYASPEIVPEAVLEHEAIAEDAMLVIRATATDASGASQTLQLQVRRPSPWDYAGTATFPTAILEDCAGAVTQGDISGEDWSFTRANLTAVLADSSEVWDGSAIVIAPSASLASISGRTNLATPATDGAALCDTDKQLVAPGQGALVVGLPADADAGTAWASLRWGFESTDARLSDCSFELTDLGRSLAGGTNWLETADATTCTTGPETPTNFR